MSPLQLLICLFLLAFSLSAAEGAGHKTGQITFAQVTDAHLFDEGWNQPMAQAFQQAAENWRALRWSIDEINSLVKDGQAIDFVVYTGDLGLQNVDFPPSAGCMVHPVSAQAGLPPIPEKAAVDDLAAELDRLLVRKVLFVAGNNDPWEEDASDGRYDCFLAALREKLGSSSEPLRVEKLEPDHAIEMKGISLLGLNSASFKKAANYERVCSQTVSDRSAQELLHGSCPQQEMDVLDQQLQAGKPVLLFTHVPDLQDPFRRQPAWDLSPAVRHAWESEASLSNVLGIFAGHFHDSNRALYGTTMGVQELAVSKPVADKTYVAPPLAIKNQANKLQKARGFLLGTATSSGVSKTEVIWLPDTEQYTANRNGSIHQP